jgi:hypothetical protein
LANSTRSPADQPYVMTPVLEGGKIWKAYVSDSSVSDPADGDVHYFARNYAISGSNGSERVSSARCWESSEWKERRCHKAFLVDWVAQMGSFQVRSVARHGIIVRPHSDNPAALSTGENCGRLRSLA